MYGSDSWVRALRMSVAGAAFAASGACAWFDGTGKTAKLESLWFAPVGAAARGTPVVVGERVVQAFADRTLRGFELRTGRQLWSSVTTDEGLWPTRLLVGPDSVVVVTAASSVRGYSPRTGQLLWTHHPPSDSSLDLGPGSTAINTLGVNDARTMVAVPAWGSTVSALRVADGQTVWRWSAPRDHQRRHGADGAVWCGDRVFVSLWRYIDERGVPSEHSVVALDAATGRVLWTTTLPFSPIVVAANGWMECDDERVWVTTQSGPLWALSRANGDVLRRQDRARGAGNNAGPRRAGNRVYADAGLDAAVVAYLASDGTTLWRTPIIGTPYIRLVGGQDYLWMSNGSFVYIFRTGDGRLLFTDKYDGRAVLDAPLLLTERDAILPLESGIARVRLR